MRNNQTYRLIAYLQNKGIGTFVPAEELAAALGVSRRQIQKYIAALNGSRAVPFVLSDRSGYALNPACAAEVLAEIKIDQAMTPETPEARKNYIIQKLLSSPDGYNIFAFAEELCVSDATIESDLKQVRWQIRKSALQLKREKNLILLHGEEKDKRSLMTSLLNSAGYDYFVLSDAVQFLSSHYQLPNLLKKIREIFIAEGVYANDYALNNLALHLIIMVERITKHCELQDFPLPPEMMETDVYRASAKAIRYIETKYQLRVNDAELNNFALLAANNTSAVNYLQIDAENITRYVDQKYLQITEDVLQHVESTYHLDPFNKEFIATFALHIKNLFQRAGSTYKINNPLTQTIKTSYPLIYDIAVFIGQTLHKTYEFEVSEDEIAFIAFHIGSYFENNVLAHNKISCIFVYADYYGFFRKQLNRILEVFGDSLNIIDTVQVDHYDGDSSGADLIISLVEMPFSAPHVVLNPFLSDKDIRNLRTVIEELIAKKKANSLRNYLTQLFHPSTFYAHLPDGTRDEIIRYMAEDLVQKKYARPAFIPEVFAREAMSSTAFNTVAVPHALSADITESFIAFGLCDKPVDWDGKNSVSLVALIGVNDDSRRMFAQIFDYLIDTLSDPLHVSRLLQAHTYDDFLTALTQMSGLSAEW